MFFMLPNRIGGEPKIGRVTEEVTPTEPGCNQCGVPFKPGEQATRVLLVGSEGEGPGVEVEVRLQCAGLFTSGIPDLSEDGTSGKE